MRYKDFSEVERKHKGELEKRKIKLQRFVKIDIQKKKFLEQEIVRLDENLQLLVNTIRSLNKVKVIKKDLYTYNIILELLYDIEHNLAIALNIAETLNKYVQGEDRDLTKIKLHLRFSEPGVKGILGKLFKGEAKQITLVKYEWDEIENSKKALERVFFYLKKIKLNKKIVDNIEKVNKLIFDVDRILKELNLVIIKDKKLLKILLKLKL